MSRVDPLRDGHYWASIDSTLPGTMMVLWVPRQASTQMLYLKTFERSVYFFFSDIWLLKFMATGPIVEELKKYLHVHVHTPLLSSACPHVHRLVLGQRIGSGLETRQEILPFYWGS